MEIAHCRYPDCPYFKTVGLYYGCGPIMTAYRCLAMPGKGEVRENDECIAGFTEEYVHQSLLPEGKLDWPITVRYK